MGEASKVTGRTIICMATVSIIGRMVDNMMANTLMIKKRLYINIKNSIGVWEVYLE
jgi:hypothetical protein